jgi:methyl-accepting chemotaxis protein
LSLIGAIAGLCAVTAVLSVSTFVEMTEMDIRSETLIKDWVPSLDRSKEVDTSLSNLRLAYATHILAKDAAGTAAADALVIAQKQRMEQALNGYAALVSSSETKQQEALKVVRSEYAELAGAGEELLKASRAGADDKAKDIFDTGIRSVGDKLAANIDAIIALNLEGSQRAGALSKAAMSNAFTVTYIVTALGILIAIAAVAFAVTGIANPILRITAAMRKLAEGDTATAIPFAGRSDEIGTMATAVEVFRQAAISNKRLEEDAETARRQAEQDRIAAQQRAEADAAERLRIATSGLAAGLHRLAEGDLAFQLDQAFAPDFEQLRHDFNRSVRQLGETLVMISQSIGTMDDGTREISAGANDLSKRTEQQAAALEETAAALDEITANVSNSARRTEEARTIAVQANDSAVTSSAVVTQAEEAMRRIEASSQQISSIIGVIDEIAFQTNLLALNAGVEAARAGEAGKGFAVVAQEVRELAQRSAKAAKEIKELIRNSAGEVDGGVKLVRDTGTALGTICGFIAEINQHMDAISVSAREQSTGLAEVNSAVNSMDQTTQQNAAMVEQSTAASSSLAMEAQKLRDLVGRFRLEGMATGQANALRRTVSAMAAPRPAPSRAPVRSGSAAAAVAQDWEEF